MSGLPVRSRLVEAIGQTRVVNSWLAKNGRAEATFLSIRQSLGLGQVSSHGSESRVKADTGIEMQ